MEKMFPDISSGKNLDVSDVSDACWKISIFSWQLQPQGLTYRTLKMIGCPKEISF